MSQSVAIQHQRARPRCDRLAKRTSRYSVVCVLSLLALATGALANDDSSDPILFLPRAGDTIDLNFPGNPAGGGFTGDLYRLRGRRSVGSFTTDIVSGELIFDVLGQLAAGQTFVTAGLVQSSFETRRGTIYEQHSPTLVNTEVPPTTPGYDRVVVVFAAGVVTGGTRGFTDATGTSSLYLKIEVDDQGMPAIVQAGTFLFAID